MRREGKMKDSMHVTVDLSKRSSLRGKDCSFFSLWFDAIKVELQVKLEVTQMNLQPGQCVSLWREQQQQQQHALSQDVLQYMGAP